MFCLRMSFPSNRQSSSQGVGPALSLCLLPHTQPATKGCWLGLPAAWVLPQPHPISCLDSFKSLPASKAPIIPPVGGALGTPTHYLHFSLPNLAGPPLVPGESPGWSAWGYHAQSRPPPPPVACPSLPPSLCTSSSCACEAFSTAPTPPLIPHPLVFVPHTISPRRARKLLPSLSICTPDPYTRL